MDPKSILIERQDHIFTITLNRPDKLNAFINDMLVEVREAVTGADADPETRTIIITGAGRAFSAGADLNAFKSALEESKRQGRQVTGVDQQLLAQFAVEMDRLSTPVIAAINGPAVGVGFTLPLACDIRIASERATLGGVFVRVGLTPELGSTYNLTRLVGIARASELVFTARIVDAQEAKEMGLVNRVVPHDELMPAALEMARTIAGFSPIAMGWAKRNLHSGIEGSLANQVQLETLANRICRETQDYEEAVTAFLEKRQPVIRGK